MTSRFEIDLISGMLTLGGVRINPGHVRSEAVRLLAPLAPEFLFGNLAQPWLTISFGGKPAKVVLIFVQERLAWAWLHPRLDGQVQERKVSEREAEREVTFVRSVLIDEYGIDVGEHAANFPWGEVISGYGPHGRKSMTQHGISYHSREPD